MVLQFTPAAQRALKAASHWTSSESPNGITPPELLLGLLAEAECRAASMLAARGIDVPLVRQRWPELQFSQHAAAKRGDEFSAAVQAALDAAATRLIDYPPPLTLATEHLLLGLAAAEGELAAWLAERGLAVEPLEQEVHRLAGHQSGPLSVEGIETGETLTAARAFAADRSETEPVGAPAGMPELRSIDTPPHPGPLPKGEGIQGRLCPETVPKGERTALLRIIDAASNRGREGLRMLEDVARFALDDVALTDQLKQLRHTLAAELAKFDSSSLLAARNTPEDVGTQLTAVAERGRADLRAVVAANFKRVQESLRSLEEFGKTFDAHFGAAMKQLRYRVYALERDATTLSGARPSANCRIERASLYALVDGRESLAAFTALVETLVSAEVDVIQLRDKRLDDRELLARARRLRALTRGTHTLFVMNDRADLAVLAAADGVHVGQEELAVRDARTIIGPQALIGVSTHSLEQARQAVLDGADYIGVGPTFASMTKQFDARQLTGLALLEAVAAEIQLPAFAIGGVNVENLRDVLAAGVSRVAVSGAILSAADPYETTRLLQRQLTQKER